MRDLNASKKAQPKVKGSPQLIKAPSTSRRQKLKLRRPLPRAAKEKGIVC